MTAVNGAFFMAMIVVTKCFVSDIAVGFDISDVHFDKSSCIKTVTGNI